MKKNLICKWMMLGIVLVGIGIDQLTKMLAVKYLSGIPTHPLWKNVLHLTYVENRGAAFGMLADNRWVFMVISTVALAAILVYYYFFAKKYTYLSTVALAMIVSGGIGNMIDRVALGYVVDFIDFTLIDFAVFNGADSFVCVGAGILILAILLDPDAKQSVKQKDARKKADK